MGLGEHIGDPRVKSRAMTEKTKDKPVRDDTWRTCRRVLQHLQKVMGPIGLDPAGNPGGVFAQTTILLPEYEQSITKWVEGFEANVKQILVGDGLIYTWAGHGLTFLNNPWSNCAPWMKKASEDGDEVVVLTQARMNAIWMHEHAFESGCEAVGFPRGRVHYETSRKVPQPPFHSVFLYYGARRELFQKFIETLPGGKRTTGGGRCLFVR